MMTITIIIICSVLKILRVKRKILKEKLEWSLLIAREAVMQQDGAEQCWKRKLGSPLSLQRHVIFWLNSKKNTIEE